MGNKRVVSDRNNNVLQCQRVGGDGHNNAVSKTDNNLAINCLLYFCLFMLSLLISLLCTVSMCDYITKIEIKFFFLNCNVSE